MENERKQKWLTVLFFSVSGIVFGGALYLITAGATASPQPTPPNVAAAVEALPYPDDEPRVLVTLKRDTRQQLGSLDIVYRGVKNRKIYLDVYVRDLDPHYAYRHAITLEQANDGFELGGVQLELLSARSSRAKIVWIRNT
jgi:hypothetical protein